MKSIILLGDGMADEPLEDLGGRTPLDVAYTPYMDKLASRGEFGMVRTVKSGFPPGSDVANMSVLGLDPSRYYSGRAPIEAVSMGLDLHEDDTAFRINLVTLTQRENGLIMEDYCSDHITTSESGELIDKLKILAEKYEGTTVYPGIEYRHLMVVRGFENQTLHTTPPHDITGEYIDAFLPDDEFLVNLIHESMTLLKDHPINIARRKLGKREATAIWPWGEGKMQKVPTLQDEYGVSGAMISAVDLLRGMGMLRGMEIISVPGATGWIDTNYLGKAQAALDALTHADLVYVHVEAPDEAGHAGLLREKIQAIENFDEMVVGHVLTNLESQGIPFKVLFLPDHPTPIAKRTHTSDPVPFVLYDSTNTQNNTLRFTEQEARDTGLFIEEGYSLLGRLLQN
ncbi:MAG TPA: cofactor-independent phosphoglycerate mutase [Deltaproteobacteria bacterium]|nr:cofactor-independent phosphoglycerate mutase [Deltaproteobacteria bacterium]